MENGVQIKSSRVGQQPYAERTVARCFICSFPVSSLTPDMGETTFRGKPVNVCSPCRAKYFDPKGQIARYGKRFRFVTRSEIPYPTDYEILAMNGGHRMFRQIYKILLLAKERQEIRHKGTPDDQKHRPGTPKEVNWMVEDMSVKMLKLSGRVARAMVDSFVIQGDDATIEDDVALLKIKDLLEEIDPNIFKNIQAERERKRKKKRLS